MNEPINLERRDEERRGTEEAERLVVPALVYLVQRRREPAAALF